MTPHRFDWQGRDRVFMLAAIAIALVALFVGVLAITAHLLGRPFP